MQVTTIDRLQIVMDREEGELFHEILRKTEAAAKTMKLNAKEIAFVDRLESEIEDNLCDD